jgi:hypothetical protein
VFLAEVSMILDRLAFRPVLAMDNLVDQRAAEVRA